MCVDTNNHLRFVDAKCCLEMFHCLRAHWRLLSQLWRFLHSEQDRQFNRRTCLFEIILPMQHDRAILVIDPLCERSLVSNLF